MLSIKKLLNHLLNITKWVIGQKSMWKFEIFNLKWKNKINYDENNGILKNKQIKNLVFEIF
jgi:hypothetical protein